MGSVCGDSHPDGMASMPAPAGGHHGQQTPRDQHQPVAACVNCAVVVPGVAVAIAGAEWITLAPVRTPVMPPSFDAAPRVPPPRV